MTRFVDQVFHTPDFDLPSPAKATPPRRFPILSRLAAAPALALLVGLLPGAAHASCTDLSLVLAIDSSSSIDIKEFALQARGYAAALINPEVHKALADAGEVEVAVVFWADASIEKQVIPWQHIGDVRDAAALAARIVEMPRRSFGSTDIGSGLDTALDLLDLPNRCTSRAVVNISGDGSASEVFARRKAIPIQAARARATALGVTVNALAILTDEPALDHYFTDNVVTGPGAFVMTVDDFDTFADAIQRKLVREIAPFVGAALTPSAQDGHPRGG